MSLHSWTSNTTESLVYKLPMRFFTSLFTSLYFPFFLFLHKNRINNSTHSTLSFLCTVYLNIFILSSHTSRVSTFSSWLRLKEQHLSKFHHRRLSSFSLVLFSLVFLVPRLFSLRFFTGSSLWSGVVIICSTRWRMGAVIRKNIQINWVYEKSLCKT